jgi:hypothetical protein
MPRFAIYFATRTGRLRDYAGPVEAESSGKAEEAAPGKFGLGGMRAGEMFMAVPWDAYVHMPPERQ